MNADAGISPRHTDVDPDVRTAAGAGGALPGGVALTLSATADAPTLARRAAADALAHWQADRRDAALLVISELVTNAVRHGSSGPADDVSLRVRRNGRGARIEVTDACAGGAAPDPAEQAPSEPERRRSGWGLPIVAELSDRWGVERERDRTCVWCEIDD